MDYLKPMKVYVYNFAWKRTSEIWKKTNSFHVDRKRINESCHTKGEEVCKPHSLKDESVTILKDAFHDRVVLIILKEEQSDELMSQYLK